MKKKIGIIIGMVICAILVFTGGYYFASKNMSSKGVSSNKAIAQQKPKEDDKIDGFDLGVLTKDEFHRAESLGQKYKGKDANIEGINQITNNQDVFQKTYGAVFVIYTPYALVINASKTVAEQYLDINDKNIIQKLKDGNTDINTFECLALVGGDDVDFLKQLHIVLKIYGKNGTKVLQPIKTYMQDGSGLAETTNFWPNSPSYRGGFSGVFNAKDIISLKPTKLEIIVVYPDGREAKQSFDYNQLNQL